jgi:phosphatidylglycerol---prolipoprotein diacylglyceryl transferase
MMRIHETGREWVYGVLVVVALASLFVFPASRTIEDPSERRKYKTLQLISLVFAIVGAKLAVLAGDRGWPVVPLASPWLWLESGRSITGGLILGHVAAEIAKPIIGFHSPPNDHFAAKLPFSIAIGRLGCFLAGCCRGIPHEGWLSVRYDDEVARYPAQLFEILFQLVTGFLFIWLVRRGALRGRVFALYMVLYGVFRFATEFLRETPKHAMGISVYQYLSVVMIAIGTFGIVLRSRARPVAAALPTGEGALS